MRVSSAGEHSESILTKHDIHTPLSELRGHGSPSHPSTVTAARLTSIEIGFSWGQPNYGSLDSYFHDNEDQEQLDQLGGNAKKSIHAITTSP
ncbi:hypothetical protein ACS0ZG_29480 [Burkholderia gladioli]|uniref:hypothetical protein n=1 Tax=Burkholderia gladioli TaxID=28095 RepID=UPI003F79A283